MATPPDPLLRCPHCETWDSRHRGETVRILGHTLTVITCPRMVGWALVWSHDGRAGGP